MASSSILSSQTLKLNQSKPTYISFTPTKPTFHNPKKTQFKPNSSSSFNSITDNILETTLHLDKFPIFKSGYENFQTVTESLPDSEKWGVVLFSGLIWIYLTARPGVLIGAIDTYVLANAQKVFDGLLQRRNLKSRDFLIGDKLGEGSFGVVYSGVVVPKNFTIEDSVRISGSRRKQLEKDERFKEKVILKQVNLHDFKFHV